MSDDEEPNTDLSDEVRLILSKLTAREAKILKDKFGISMESDVSLKEIGKQFDITRERIREIENRALSKIRDRKKTVKRKCSFCGKDESQVEKLIVSDVTRAHICSDCINICNDLLDD